MTKSFASNRRALESKLLNKQFTLSVNVDEIEQVSAQKLLGLKIDNQQNFSDHTDDLCKRVLQTVGVLKKIECNLPLRKHKQTQWSG